MAYLDRTPWRMVLAAVRANRLYVITHEEPRTAPAALSLERAISDQG
jgi:hypothetical protein